MSYLVLPEKTLGYAELCYAIPCAAREDLGGMLSCVALKYLFFKNVNQLIYFCPTPMAKLYLFNMGIYSSIIILFYSVSSTLTVNRTNRP